MQRERVVELRLRGSEIAQAAFGGTQAARPPRGESRQIDSLRGAAARNQRGLGVAARLGGEATEKIRPGGERLASRRRGRT